MDAHTIATININGLKSPARIAMLGAFLRTHEVDIALIQEATSPIDLSTFHYTTHLNIGSEGRGTALITRTGFDLRNVTMVPSRRIITAEYANLKMVNVYAPSGTARRTEREAFFNADLPFALGHFRQDLLVGGDFNCVVTTNDVTGGANHSRALAAVIQGYSLRDVWQNDSRRKIYTHYTGHGASRLDRIYVTNNLWGAKQHVETLPAAFTDHFAVVVRLTATAGVIRGDTDRGN
jgi:exonuclease III